MQNEYTHRMAAHACGKSLEGWEWSDESGGFFWRHKGERGDDAVEVWRPLRDNEDAFRLLVDIAKYAQEADLVLLISSMTCGNLESARISILKQAAQIGSAI